MKPVIIDQVFAKEEDFITFIATARDKGIYLSRDISNATELKERPWFFYKNYIRQLALYRDRIYTGLEPMYDYFAIDGYFFKVPKTALDIYENEACYVPGI